MPKLVRIFYRLPISHRLKNYFKSVYLICICAGLWLDLGCDSNKKTDYKQQVSSTNTTRPMQVQIVTRKLFTAIPSASGMELIGDKIYVIGDDSPYLYILNRKSFALEDKIKLFETNLFNTGRIPKAFKPDLECLTSVQVNGQPYLAAFSSGSAPIRTKCYLIALSPTNDVSQVQEYALKDFYTVLQTEDEYLQGDLLNIEAAAIQADQLYLFQRSVFKGDNVLFRFNLPAFLQHLTQPSPEMPTCEKIRFTLPRLADLDSRFSGAITFDDKLFITASVENTSNAILDGEVAGSFVGWANLNAIKPGSEPVTLHTALIQDAQGQTYKGKVEALVITGRTNAHTYQALAFTDNDNGESELLVLELTL